MMTKRMICAMILVLPIVFSAAAESGRVECILRKREEISVFAIEEVIEAEPEEIAVLLEQICVTVGQIETTAETVQKTTNVEHTTAAEPVSESFMDVGKPDTTDHRDADTSAEVPETEVTETAPAKAEDTEETAEKTEEHEHVWKTDVIFHEAVTHTVHHEEITEQRWVSVPETVITYVCDVCGKKFSSQADIYAHEDATYQKAMETGDFSGVHTGHTTVFSTVDNGHYETVTVEEARDETVTDAPGWEEKHTYCEVCGAEG